MTVTLHQGSILDSKADCIVNPANTHLRHDGGLARVIQSAAQGSKETIYPQGQARDVYHDPRGQQWDNEQAAAPLIATGNAYTTSAGKLPFKAVIHAVGPVWNGGGFCESQLLWQVHISAIDRASDAGFSSIAFPAISAGVFGFPVDQAAPQALHAARYAESLDIDVEFWLFEDAHMEAYEAAAARYV